MKQGIIGGTVALVALAAGISGAYVVSRVIPKPQLVNITQQDLNLGKQPFSPQGSLPGFRQGFNPGTMKGERGQQRSALERISTDKAIADAKAYVAKISPDLQVSEVMEFEDNDYAVVKEKSTGKGAMELLMDPFTGRVSPEIGPNMMWNLKYGHMHQDDKAVAKNQISMADAVKAAQKELDQDVNDATVNSDGVDFYGYYIFDYSVNGKIIGMLSVNGESGQVWFHDWHGAFISETEVSK
jgi:hypothetical protein